MKYCNVQHGVHTFEVGQPLTKNQFQAIWDKGRSSGRVISKKTGKAERYTLQGNQHNAEGIRIVLYSIPQRQAFHISIQIEPCRVLGSEDPTALYHASKKSYEKLADLCDQYLTEQNVPGSIRDMKISRCDVTANLMFEHQDYVDAYLRILKKSILIKGYQAGGFRLDEKRAKDPKRANEHSFSMKCKSATLLCYDKIDQMEMTGRASTKRAHQGILRLEAQLKRPALTRHLAGEMDTNYNLLAAAADRSGEILSGYLAQMFPRGDMHLKYRQAEECIRKMKKENMREKMQYLLRKTSDSANLGNAKNKLIKKYGLTKKQTETVLDCFDELELSPITLPTAGGFETLPALISLIKGKTRDK